MQVKLKDIIFTVPDKKFQIKNSEILTNGLYQVVDQTSLTSGFYNDKSKCFSDGECILFCDHTSRIFYSNHEFVIGCDGIKIIKIKNGLNINQKYIYYALLNNYHGDGKYRRHFGDLKDCEIFLPDIKIQNKIVDILSNIDNQIERNDTIIERLQDLAQTTYSRWFNQFEFPNNEGESYKSNGGEFVYNKELEKEIPIDWKVLSLSDCVSLNTRGISQVEEEGKQIVPVINQKCIRNGNILINEVYYHNDNKCLNNKLYFLDVLINSMGTGTLGRISPFIIDMDCVHHSCVTLLRINQSIIISKAYLYLAIKQMETVITAMGTGSTGQTSLNNKELGKIKILVPTPYVQNKFENIILPFFKQMQCINMENINLINLKSKLLPLLINGQLNI